MEATVLSGNDQAIRPPRSLGAHYKDRLDEEMAENP